MRWLQCFDCFCLHKEKKKTTYRSIHPGSQNNSTYNSSLVHQNSSNLEVATLMAQLHKSRRNSCGSFRSSKSVESCKVRRFSETSEEHFLKIMSKRRKDSKISPTCLPMYQEIAGVLILTHQLRQEQRRSPPIPLRPSSRKNTA